MITFIRHNFLEKPFDDYNNLDYKDLVALSNQTISPDISKNLNKTIHFKKLQKSQFYKIYTSTQKRTISTANILWYREIESLDLLNEIYFDIQKIVTSDEYKKYWLKIIRKRLWEYIFLWNDWVELLKDIIKRIDIFIEKCKKYKWKKILVISHWFLLIFIRLRLNWFTFNNNINYNTLNLSPIDYLDWFDYNGY